MEERNWVYVGLIFCIFKNNDSNIEIEIPKNDKP